MKPLDPRSVKQGAINSRVINGVVRELTGYSRKLDTLGAVAALLIMIGARTARPMSMTVISTLSLGRALFVRSGALWSPLTEPSSRVELK